MIYSGILVLIFAILHVSMFKYGDQGTGTLYDLVIDTFKTPLFVAWYAFAMLVMGFHLWHAFQSAFQTLGFHTQKKLKSASTVISIILAGGFGFLPLWAFFFK